MDLYLEIAWATFYANAAIVVLHLVAVVTVPSVRRMWRRADALAATMFPTKTRLGVYAMQLAMVTVVVILTSLVWPICLPLVARGEASWWRDYRHFRQTGRLPIED